MLPIQIREKGFTLLEMLVSIAIVAILGVATSTVLNRVVGLSEVATEAQDNVMQLQRTLVMMQRDFSQTILREQYYPENEEETDDYDYDLGLVEETQMFSLNAYEIESDSQSIVFFRLGWLNLGAKLARGSIQKVFYRIKDGNLERGHYLYPDPIEGQEPIVRTILSDVIDMTFSFKYKDGWSDNYLQDKVPTAIGIELDTERFGVIKTKYALVELDALYQAIIEGSDDAEK